MVSGPGEDSGAFGAQVDFVMEIAEVKRERSSTTTSCFWASSCVVPMPLAPAQGRGRGSRKRPRGTPLVEGCRKRVEGLICSSLQAPTYLVQREAAPAMRVISHLVLHFIAAFPLPREDVRIPAAYAGARLAVELAAELIDTLQ